MGVCECVASATYCQGVRFQRHLRRAGQACSRGSRARQEASRSAAVRALTVRSPLDSGSQSMSEPAQARKKNTAVSAALAANDPFSGAVHQL